MSALTGLMRPLSYLVALLLAAGGVGVYRAQTADERGTYRVTAYFEKAIGLFPNSDVNVLGVPVGTILSVEPVGTRVKVEMEIADEHKVPADAFAQIVPISVISDRYIQLEPPYEGGPALEDGAVLDVDRTQIPAELDDVFKQLKKLLDAIDPGKEGEPGALGELIVQLDKTLADRELDLKGTLIHASDLTATLAGAQEDLSGLLINLDDLFGTLATRASSLGELNRNFAVVMTAIAESRDDLEGTLANLASVNEQVGDLVLDHRQRLNRDVDIAAKVLRTVLRHRESFETSLHWLPIFVEGLRKARHGEPFDDVDVRDNEGAKVECEMFDPLPDGPVKDALIELCLEETGQPPPASATSAGTDIPSVLELPLDCDESVKKVRRQIKRLTRIELPPEVTKQIVRPLQRRVHKLSKTCAEVGDAIGKRFLRRLQDIGSSPVFDEPVPGIGPLSGSAAGAAAVPAGEDGPDSGGSWWSGFLGFLGWSS